MVRRYVQRARAESAQQTRRQILDAAREGLLDPGGMDVGLASIATRAGVARSTVYTTFGSRGALYAELADETLHRAGLDDVIGAFRDPDPVAALERSIGAACAMYAADRDAIARLLALGQVDPEAAEPLAQSDRDRRLGMDDLVRRLGEAGLLRPALDPDEGAAALSVLTGFWAYDELATGRGLGPAACTAVLVATARASVLREGR
jgi:AcrR family transcriptional regulator